MRGESCVASPRARASGEYQGSDVSCRATMRVKEDRKHELELSLFEHHIEQCQPIGDTATNQLVHTVTQYSA